MKFLLILALFAIIIFASLCMYVFLDTFMMAVVFMPFGLSLLSEALAVLVYIATFSNKGISKQMQHKSSLNILRNVVYACFYWGFYALGHHFGSQIEIDGINIMHESGYEPIIVAIFVYILSAFFVTTMSTDKKI